jgi:FKBP-type peptidyl-prolyl cis-trans isomerase
MATFAMLKAPVSRAYHQRNAALTPRASSSQSYSIAPPASLRRRDTLLASGTLLLSTLLQQPQQARADDFTVTPSGLRYLDLRPGTGATPQKGDTVVVHWSGYTKGYQGKRIDNTSVRDEPYVFKLGSGEAIGAFEEAVSTMQPGGVRRVEVPGDVAELGYSLDRSVRFTNETFRDGIYKYRYGPQPAELSGQRALDFVLDNETLQPFNRTLLFDIKLLSVRPKK